MNVTLRAWTRRALIALALPLLGLPHGREAAWAQAAGAQAQTPPADPSLDGLDQELLEGLEEPEESTGEKPGDVAPKNKGAEADQGAETPDDSMDESNDRMDDLDQELLRDLDDAPPQEQAGGELADISRRMSEVKGQLAKNDSSVETREAQEKIVKDLEAMIEKLKQQMRSQQSRQRQNQNQRNRQRRNQSRQNERDQQSPQNQRNNDNPDDPNQGRGPAPDSSGKTRRDQQEKVDMMAMQNLLKHVWGALPERAREEMTQLSPEAFLPEYELEIERYFRVLAEDEPRKDAP